MIRFRTVLLLLVLVAIPILAAGCGDDETTRPVCGDWRVDSPEGVVEALKFSYRNRESTCYHALLHPRFRFYFQDGDEPPQLDRPYWTAAEDSAATHGLFTAEEVIGITLEFLYEPAFPDSLERFPGEVMRIRASPMKITVDDRDGTTWLVEGDIQDFYFVRGEGPDSTNWYLCEWRDIPGSGWPGAAVTGFPRAAAGGVTWGAIKSMFWDGVIREER